MNIKDKIKSDSVAALKNHDSKRVGVLRYLISLIDKRELQLPPNTMGETEMVSVLRKELKNKEESKEMFAKGGRQDLVEEQNYEIAVVKEYLPQEISEEKIAQIVMEVIAEKGNNFGLVMKEVMTKLGGAASGDVVARIVKEKISNV